MVTVILAWEVYTFVYAKSMRKKKYIEKSSPRHHKNSPREKNDGGYFFIGDLEKEPP